MTPVTRTILLHGSPLTASFRSSSQNGITTVGAVKPSSEFKNLAVMQISGTKMASWSGIDNLNTFPSLTSLRFGKSPITAVMGGSEARSVVVARVKGLDYLNGSVVREKERVEAEKVRLRTFSGTAGNELHLLHF